MARRGALAVLIAAGLPGAAWPEAWRIGPTPAWVAPIEVPAPLAAPAPDASSGSYDLLYDHQLRVSDAGTDEYVRRVIQVLSTSGVQNASEVSLDFDPSSERLVVHHVRVLRGGRDVAAFHAADVSVIRPERESEDAIYSGTLSALVFLRDVRPGDVLDYAYSLLGTAPSPAPGFVESLQMAYSVPIGRLRHRLLWPAGRSLHQMSLGSVEPPRVRQTPTGTEYVWEREGVPAIPDEGDLPDWFDPYPAVELGEFESWGDVARWTAQLYDAVDPGTSALDALLSKWTDGAVEARALRAVRFVQDDVRYLGLEIGPGAWEPRPPATVLARRYGDCKDKSLLLAALLRRMGLDARPALVSTHAGRSLDARLPSPLPFDHVIVRLKLPGGTHWIDPTLAHQGGTLREIVPPRFERALVVDASSAGLETIPQPSSGEPTTTVEEELTAPASGLGRLVVRADYRGADADDIRATLADTSATDLASSYLNHYASLWHEIQAEGALAVEDRRDANRIRIQGTYRIPDFWITDTRSLEAWSLADVLERPATVRRTMPLAVEHPTRLSHRIALSFAAEPDDVPAAVTIEDPAFRFTRASSLDGSRLSVLFAYETRADSVAPEELARYLADIDSTRADLTLALKRPTGRRTLRRRIAIGAAFAVAGLLVAGWTVRQARLRRRQVPTSAS